MKAERKRERERLHADSVWCRVGIQSSVAHIGTGWLSSRLAQANVRHHHCHPTGLVTPLSSAKFDLGRGEGSR